MATVDRRIFGNRYYVSIEGPRELKELIEQLPVTMRKGWKCIGELEFINDSNIRVVIPHNKDSWRQKYLEFGRSNIHAIDNSFLPENLKKEIMDRFIREVIEPFCEIHTNIKHGWQWEEE